jgi:Domain of unknown function (DUF4505)
MSKFFNIAKRYNLLESMIGQSMKLYMNRPIVRLLSKIKRIEREYFYDIDVHGQLFLTETHPKNLTSCFKDLKFLDFFYARLKLAPEVKHEGYTHISPCAGELNWVRVSDCPIVFHSLDGDSLVYAGTRSVKFKPDQLLVSKASGRFYHPIEDGMAGPAWTDRKIGLIKSALVQSHLSETIEMEDHTFSLNGKRYPLKFF